MIFSRRNGRWRSRGVGDVDMGNPVNPNYRCIIGQIIRTDVSYVWDIPTEEAAAVRVMEGGGTAEVLIEPPCPGGS